MIVSFGTPSNITLEIPLNIRLRIQKKKNIHEFRIKFKEGNFDGIDKAISENQGNYQKNSQRVNRKISQSYIEKSLHGHI